MSDTDALIAKALANAPGGPLRARLIRRVEAHLVGHAFKSASDSDNGRMLQC